MSRPSYRLSVIQNHVDVITRTCSVETTHHATSREIRVNPTVGMVDDKVRIQLNGFQAGENVTLAAKLKENRVEFESRCVYKIDDNGCADNFSSASSGGSFLGIEPMGLFWSLISDPPARLIKKDVNAPMCVNIQVFPGTHIAKTLPEKPVSEVQVQRFFLRPGVRRIPLSGKFKGVIFVPEGKGPFPAVIDLFGGLVSLIETRAALLASHGYVTMALSYLFKSDLAPSLKEVDLNYIQEALIWMSEQEYVDKNKLGALGLCFGGSICMKLTSLLPQIRAVINVNGIPFSPSENVPGFETLGGNAWPDKNKVFLTEEGFDVSDIYDCESPFIHQAWKHGAKILIIVGEDDKQVHPKWHPYFYDKCPDEYKSNVQMYRYLGAGHMIEPPYTPHVRSTDPGRKRLQTIFFIPEKYHDKPMMAGGWTDTHAIAQEDSWRKILQFLEINLKNI